MVKLDKLRAGIISGDVAMWQAADRTLANAKTTAYKRTVLETLMSEHPRPAEAVKPTAPAPTVPTETAPVVPVDPALAMSKLLADQGLSQTVIDIAIAIAGVASPTVTVAPAEPAPEMTAVSDEDVAAKVAIEEDPILKARKREARRLAQEQYDVRTLKLAQPVGFTSYIRGPLGREAFEENLEALITANWTPAT